MHRTRSVFLHFLNRDVLRLSTAGQSMPRAQLARTLNRSLTASILLSADAAILPPGFALETDVALRVLLSHTELLTGGYIKFAAREFNLGALVEKKRSEYGPWRESFPGLFSDKMADRLGAAGIVLIPRRTRIGETASENWSNVAATKYTKAFEKLSTAEREAVLQAPETVVRDGHALTWESVLPALPELNGGLREIQVALQHNYLSLYESEYNAVSIQDIPGIPTFGLTSQDGAYSLRRLALALQAIGHGDLLDARDDELVEYIGQPGFESFLDLVIESIDHASSPRALQALILRYLPARNGVSDDQLMQAIDNLRREAGLMTTTKSGQQNMTAVIVTANRRESQGVREAGELMAGGTWREGLDLGMPRWILELPAGSQKMEISLVQADETGGANAVHTLNRVMESLSPRVVLFVGCAMLLDERASVEPRAVYWARRAIDGSKGEVTDSTFDFDMESASGDTPLRRIAELAAQAQELDGINLITNRDFVSVSQFLRGSNSELRKGLLAQLPRDTVVGEMEAFAVFRNFELQLQEGRHPAPVGIVKGISDVGDNDAQLDKKQSQVAASRDAGIVAFHVLRRVGRSIS